MVRRLRALWCLLAIALPLSGVWSAPSVTDLFHGVSVTTVASHGAENTESGGKGGVK